MNTKHIALPQRACQRKDLMITVMQSKSKINLIRQSNQVIWLNKPLIVIAEVEILMTPQGKKVE